ncbi:hypothetical protein [Cellulomonas gelida]|uniref:Regulatory protein RecX n=1 Tax=Cellulomonas gelida TaxID=1712 RepID=A0A4Y3KJ26_9CELL|nr:hypothetical protein [Cellulomonas gelida]GEA84409.1 hypothetical protein CGE01nite_16600 [Cellulomonas gelida]GGL26468.1 hypothetical protein GCM10009774_16130 [Cellulomonas gelida]
MKPLDAVRAMVADALGTEPVDRYTAARARAAREKPDRMTFQPVRRARRKTAKRDQRREYVDQLREQGFDAEYLADRYGRRR